MYLPIHVPGAILPIAERQVTVLSAAPRATAGGVGAERLFFKAHWLCSGRLAAKETVAASLHTYTPVQQYRVRVDEQSPPWLRSGEQLRRASRGRLLL